MRGMPATRRWKNGVKNTASDRYMGHSDTLIRKMFNSLLITNTISLALSVACVLIDSVITGNFLGDEALVASGLVQPVVLLINTVGMMIGPGLSIMVTRYMGKAEPRRIDQIFSIVMYANIAVFMVLGAVLYAAAPSIASLLGSKAGDSAAAMTADYLRGYSFGLIPMRISMILSGVLTIDNDRKRAVRGMALILAGDVVLDLVNVLAVRGGMYGMALASAGSCLLAMLYLLTHFAKKDRILHFTFSGLRADDLKDVLLCGLPNLINVGGQALRGFAFNTVLLIISGGSAVAAMSVCNSAFSLVISLLAAVLVSTAVLSSMLYGEEDRSGLTRTLVISVKTACASMMIIMAGAIVFAKPVAAMFLKTDSPEILVQAVRFMRVYALQLFLVSGTYSLSGVWQGTNKLGLNYLVSLLRDCIFPVTASCLPGLTYGIRGFEAGFIAAGALTLAACFAVHLLINRKISVKAEDLLLLDDDFGTAPGESFETSLNTKEAALEASEQVGEFCLSRGADLKTAERYALFIEEIACNTIEHGFTDAKRGSLDIRVIYSDDREIIRFRDNGRPFDPVKWLKLNHPNDPLKGAGIRIVVGMAKEVRYMPAMGLNNLLIIL